MERSKEPSSTDPKHSHERARQRLRELRDELKEITTSYRKEFDELLAQLDGFDPEDYESRKAVIQEINGVRKLLAAGLTFNGQRVNLRPHLGSSRHKTGGFQVVTTSSDHEALKTSRTLPRLGSTD